jgi:hypothetical protein
MKIIVTESQLKNLKENKIEKMKQFVQQNIEQKGIFDTGKMLGMDYDDVIEKFNISFDDERVKELIKYYIDEKMDKIYNFEKDKDFYCERYETPKTFLNVVEEAILEFLYNNYYADFLDDDSVEFENVIYLVSNYTKKNYGDVIKNKFIENCKK